MKRVEAMKAMESFLKQDIKYLYKEQRINLHQMHLSFQMDSNKYNLQANLDFREDWLDVLVFISPTALTIGSDSYWQALQTVNFVNWYTKGAGRFYIDSYGDLAYSIRLQYDFIEREQLMAFKEIEVAIDYYTDLFIPFLNVCIGKSTFEDVKEIIDVMYGEGMGSEI